MWSVSSILTGLLSFMMDNSPTTVSVKTTSAEKQCLAKSSLSFNCKNVWIIKSKGIVDPSMAAIASFFTPSSSLNFKPLPSSFHLNPTTRRPFHHLTITKAQGDNNNSNSSSSATTNDQPLFVTAQDVPLEGVIQFDKPTSSSSSSRIQKWGRVALLAGVDVLALLVFATIGRYSHGLSTMDLQTLRTADPFIAGWFLGAYFLGGYGEDGRGMKGVPSGVIATAKSWAVGIPIGIAIRTATSGNLPNYGFIFVSLGSTAVLLITFRALLYTLLPLQNQNKADDDVYRRGSPFELFELLTSLVRRW